MNKEKALEKRQRGKKSAAGHGMLVGQIWNQTYELSHDVKSALFISSHPTTANTKYLWVISLRFFSL